MGERKRAAGPRGAGSSRGRVGENGPWAIERVQEKPQNLFQVEADKEGWQEKLQEGRIGLGKKGMGIGICA